MVNNMDYSILGVPTNASFEEIKKAWRQLCKKYHPDNKETGNAVRFREINEAFKRLTDNINSHTISFENSDVDYKGILDDYIKYAFIKYKDVELVIGYLNTYLDGNVKGITRDNNYRQLFQDFLTVDIVSSIIGNNIEQYVNDTIRRLNPGYDAFLSACKATYIKYGRNQLISAIDQAIKGDFTRFTNDGRGLRERLKELANRENIYNYLVSVTGNRLDPDMPIGEQSVDAILDAVFGKSESRAR